MIRLQKLVLPVTVCMFAISVSAPAYAEKKDFKDTDITLAIEAQLLRDEAVTAHLIDVHTKDGVVTLSGSVDNLLARDQSVRIAESIRGVRGVINRISVKPETRSDEQIVMDVKNALSTDPATKPYTIEVKADQGIVTLSGTVKFWNDKQLITWVVKGVKGIKEIKNQITFDTVTVDRSDDEIQAAIERRFSLDPYVCAGMIDIEVNNGTVVLSGAVGSAAEKSRAINDAWVGGGCVGKG